ncbi:MAG: copper amine oxidase [Alicyclobacillus sp.]|nr:copper amine oxidase [Alicyclobacillus sp.]
MNWKTLTVTAATLATLALPAVSAPAFASPSPVSQTSNSAINLRSTLDQLMGEHVVLAVDAMETGYEGASDFSAVVNALNQNTQDLTKAIASIYGPAAAQQFNRMWSAHVQDFVDYVTATKNGDKAGQQAALDKLQTYKDHFANFLHNADPKYLQTSQLAQGLQEHVNLLLSTFNDFLNKDYKDAYADWVKAYNQMYQMSDALAGAIVWQFPQKFGNESPNTPAANLRISLQQLLGEHAWLAMIAMQKGYDANTGHADAADFQAVAGQLNQDTQSLTNAIASVYGSAGGAEFNKLWSAHIQDFVDYVVATVKNDPSAKQAAQNKLTQYRFAFAKFLHSANPYINADAVANVLQMHVQDLTTAFDDYVARNYDGAFATFREAYEHMSTPALAISTGIVTQFPSKFSDPSIPSQMPVTGGRGNSMTVGEFQTIFTALLAAMFAAALGAVLTLRRKSWHH